MKKKALVLGVGGQDGSYLAETLLANDYEVHGMYRRTSLGNLGRIEGINSNGVRTKDLIKLHRGDLTDTESVLRIIRDVGPHEIYNEADQDNVGWSYSAPGYSWEVTFAAVGRLLETIRLTDPSIKFFQPCTATMFGNTPPPQNEDSKFDPQSPYAVAKTAVYYICRYYRQHYGMFVSTAIFFNHDSPRRSEDYLLNKICHSAVRIAAGEQETLALGNLDTRVDIGYAPEYMKAAYKIMQLGDSDDFIIATGESPSIREICDLALSYVGVNLDRVIVDPNFYREDPGNTLRGDWRKAFRTFGFNPRLQIEQTVQAIIDAIYAEKGVSV